MDSAWLYKNLGTLAQVTLFGALILVGGIALFRKQKGRRLSKRARSETDSPKR
ncbi:MAG: hypothetical protein JXX29_11100 [Deltaproteobacteria bacterium]|nr:hypothetical protein [Deltaproteobacteria bacterium]MBN2672217.1 hypothetical protein [Deltaproteobacteria bacterium]